jgi:hypothetical protein
MGVGGVSRSRDLGGDWIRAQCKALFRLVPAPSEQVDQPEPSGSEAGNDPQLSDCGSDVGEMGGSNEPPNWSRSNAGTSGCPQESALNAEVNRSDRSVATHWLTLVTVKR